MQYWALIRIINVINIDFLKVMHPENIAHVYSFRSNLYCVNIVCINFILANIGYTKIILEIVAILVRNIASALDYFHFTNIGAIIDKNILSFLWQFFNCKTYYLTSISMELEVFPLKAILVKYWTSIRIINVTILLAISLDTV